METATPHVGRPHGAKSSKVDFNVDAALEEVKKRDLFVPEEKNKIECEKIDKILNGTRDSFTFEEWSLIQKLRNYVKFGRQMTEKQSRLLGRMLFLAQSSKEVVPPVKVVPPQ